MERSWLIRAGSTGDVLEKTGKRMITTELKPRARLPEWLRLKLPTSHMFAQTAGLLDELKLHTVCEVPNAQPLGMLEQGDGDIHDRGRPMHARVRLLRRATAKRWRWKPTSRRACRSDPAHATAPRGHHGGGAG